MNFEEQPQQQKSLRSGPFPWNEQEERDVLLVQEKNSKNQNQNEKKHKTTRKRVRLEEGERKKKNYAFSSSPVVIDPLPSGSNPSSHDAVGTVSIATEVVDDKKMDSSIQNHKDDEEEEEAGHLVDYDNKLPARYVATASRRLMMSPECEKYEILRKNYQSLYHNYTHLKSRYQQRETELKMKSRARNNDKKENKTKTNNNNNDNDNNDDNDDDNHGRSCTGCEGTTTCLAQAFREAFELQKLKEEKKKKEK